MNVKRVLQHLILPQLNDKETIKYNAGKHFEIYDVKYSMCDTIYTENTQQIFEK